jgi:hypothetical protein
MKWISPKDELPPQGKKILYLKNGDVYVVQRFKELWLPVPFYDSEFTFHEEPELWADIELPNGLTGKMKFQLHSGKMMEVDDYEMFYPDDYEELVEEQRKLWGKDAVEE